MFSTQAGLRWSNLLLSDVPIRGRSRLRGFWRQQRRLHHPCIELAAPQTPAKFQQRASPRTPFIPSPSPTVSPASDLSPQADIRVRVNSNAELSDSQSGTFTWYYGFDSNGPFNTIDFLDVISHELGHGLGFAANVDDTTGNFINGLPNAYTSNIFDAELGLSWLNMTPAQRVASSTNDPNLTWDGPNVTGAIDGVESFVSQGTSTADDDSSFDAQQAGFGGSIPATGIGGNLALVNDGVGVELNNGEGSTADLAQEIQNGAEVSGNIALIVRGLESFDVKVRRAEDAGAIAAIVYNNVANGGLFTASASGTVAEPTIPMVFISLESGNELRDLLAEGIGVTVFDNRGHCRLSGSSPHRHPSSPFRSFRVPTGFLHLPLVDRREPQPPHGAIYQSKHRGRLGPHCSPHERHRLGNPEHRNTLPDL